MFVPVSLMTVVRFRKVCEQACFWGASFDLFGYLIHWEAMVVVLSGKVAFAVGAYGVFMLHSEENRREAARRARFTVSKY